MNYVYIVMTYYKGMIFDYSSAYRTYEEAREYAENYMDVQPYSGGNGWKVQMISIR